MGIRSGVKIKAPNAIFTKQTFTLVTELSHHQVLDRLRSNTQIDNKAEFKRYKKLFKGYISPTDFKLTREVSFRNPFKAEISGKISAVDKAIFIELDMKLQPFIMIFLIIWCAGVSLFFIAFVVAAINNPKLFIGCLIPLAMLVFCYGLTILGFNIDRDESKKIITNLLEAKDC